MKKFLIFLISLLILLSPPIFSLSKSTKIILEEIKKLSLVIKDLQQQITLMHRKFQIIDDKVSAITKNQADYNQNGENLNLSIQFIKEEINELKNKITKMNDSLYSLSQKQLTDSGESEYDSSQNSLTQSPENIYYTAYSDYLKKNYELAVKGFQQFVRLFPQNGLADNSIYWIGECYYSQKMYQEAANIFDRLINEYSDGDKIPAATLKKGFALIEMGKQNTGVNVLKELISKFPLSEEASLAQQKIREILE